MKKRILSFMLALILCFGMTATVWATESPDAGDVATIPDVNVAWDASFPTGWAIKLDYIKGTEDTSLWYMLQIYRDGVQLGEYGYSVAYAEDCYDLIINMSPFINESGVYKVCVTPFVRDENGKMVLGNTAETEEKSYVRPESELGLASGSWSSEKAGVFVANGVEGAWAYEYRLYRVVNGNSVFCGWRREGDLRDMSFEDTADATYEIDYTGWITEAGEYYVTVRALSGNADTVANSQLYKSDIYSTVTTSESVGDVIGDANNYDSAQEGLNHLVSNTSKEDLEVAMQTDPSVREQVAELEENYVSQNNISLEDPVVSEEAATYVNADEISMVGAGLNAAAGNEVKLSVSTPAKEENIGSKYSNVVQLDLKLLCDDASVSDLIVPITITMPIPTGVNLANLRILHYHDGATTGTPVNYSVSADGKYITFTVDSFSTFVFANEIVSTGTNPTPVVTSPKTGDNGMVWMTAALGLAFAGVVVLRKREF